MVLRMSLVGTRHDEGFSQHVCVCMFKRIYAKI